MSNLIPVNQKHLTLDERKIIEDSLNEGLSFKEIAKYLCKDPTTISKEIRLHRVDDIQPKRIFNNPHNFCTRRFRCKRTNVCEKIILCDIKCSSCNKCNQVCKSFVKESCLRVDRAPYVCNGCDKPLHRCSIPHKYRYDAVFAQRKYEELRTSSRTGVNLTKHQALQMNAVVAPLIEQGQSPYVIVTNHPELGISVKTLYNYIEQGVLLTRNIDLKRKVKFKLRKDDSKPSIKNILLQEVLEKQMTARGYMVGPNGPVNLQIIVSQLYADVSQGNVRYNIATKADIAIIATAQNGNKMTKNYRASYNVEGAFQASNKNIADAVNSVLTDTIADMSQDTSIHEFIKQNAR